MMLDLHSLITFKKGLRINLALNLLKENDLEITENNLENLLKANEKLSSPHIINIFEIISKIPNINNKNIKQQIISKLYELLENIDKDIKDSIIIPNFLTKE